MKIGVVMSGNSHFGWLAVTPARFVDSRLNPVLYFGCDPANRSRAKMNLSGKYFLADEAINCGSRQSRLSHDVGKPPNSPVVHEVILLKPYKSNEYISEPGPGADYGIQVCAGVYSTNEITNRNLQSESEHRSSAQITPRVFLCDFTRNRSCCS